MSFKREGDDLSQLQVLKKRRVAELLANYIPEDEALLLRDGRYSCTVCFHRPVFDTLDMLTIHRSGKKHLAGLQRFYGKKVSLENEIQKRHHQAYLEAEENGTQVAQGPAPLLAQTRKITQNALLKTVPYNSCCRSKRNEASASTSGPSASFRAAETPGMPKPPGSDSVDKERQVEEEGSPSACLSSCRRGAAGMSPTSKAKSFSESSFLTEPREKKFARQGKGRKTRKSSEPDDPEKRRTLEHYLKLKSSGWIQDGSGKWVKDENVEFDTDEEEPPVLPPS
ncbi:sodium channel modifier 1-like isoform X1 [Pseudonaja textilis]|uniref:sodium channel modifier 1-like isoform X1 n=1 Tax=Pseudonaja textilis TaxID=8673 RepID=UPI000EA8AD60|nr:sodium channel modifier 1-like isoform X1 [Pseudonaja textilis]XP_026580001.1 sodium channel modifier 1-like isoform X1 [Pseudonaja textilis]